MQKPSFNYLESLDVNNAATNRAGLSKRVVLASFFLFLFSNFP